MHIHELVNELEMWKARALAAEAKCATMRSEAWPRVRMLHIRLEPVCQACGGIVNLEVHHIIPFHLNRAKELADENLITLCEAPGRECHLKIGHLGRWSDINPNVRRDAAAHLKESAK